jgi:hypothetical protein
VTDTCACVQGYLALIRDRGDLIDLIDKFEREKVVEVCRAYSDFVPFPEAKDTFARTKIFLRNFMISLAVAREVDERAGLNRMALAVRPAKTSYPSRHEPLCYTRNLTHSVLFSYCSCAHLERGHSPASQQLMGVRFAHLKVV